MIRALLWKEWREQRTVAASVLSFGALALYLTAQFAEPIGGGSAWERGGPRELMALALAYLAGAVSGAILLADEKEVGTLEFLDTLPCRRRAVWIGKAVAGGLLTVGQCALLALLAIALGSTDDRMAPLAYGLVVLLVGVLAYAWGAFGGALARSTLGAVFTGSITGFVFGFVLAVPFVVVVGARGFARAYGLPLFTYYGCWVAAGLAGSALLFTTVDQRRALHRRGPAAGRAPRRKPWLAGLRALSWLTVRQAVFVLAGMAAAALIVGAVMLAPDAQPLFIWPGVTLALGVLAGVTTLGEEQVRGVARFWAERRLPLGRLWLVKTGAHFLLAAGAALVIGAFVVAASPSLPFRSRLTLELRPQMFRFLTLGLVYGFVVGHLAGMVFKKTVVAGLVATVTAGTLAGLILPSLIGGGVAGWQVWAPAGILVVTARLLLYAWATDRVAYRGPALRAVGGAGLAVAVLAAGIGYRVVEVPLVPDELAESGYVEGLPSFEANEKTGRQVKTAATQYRQATQEAAAQAAYPGVRASGWASRGGLLAEAGNPLVRTARFGWTADADQLGPWLDLVFAADWVQTLEEAADRPPGLYEDPRDLDHFSPPEAYQNLREMVYALRARGAQRQAAGDPDAFPRLLRAGLAASRAARNHAGLAGADVAFEYEQVLLGGVADWLDRLDGRPDLVRQVLDTLARHEDAMPARPTDTFWAEQVILRNTMDRVGSWLPRYLDLKSGGAGTDPDAQAEAEANLIGFAWQVPWERVRRERLLRVQSGARVDPRWLSAIHQPNRWRVGFEGAADPEPDRRAMTRRRLARLLSALRLYDLERGGPAPTLDALVPAYFPAVPDDPYTGRPFGYRLSVGQDQRLVSREGYVALGAAASLAHPVGGLNGMWTIARVVNTGPLRGAVPNPPINVYQSVPAGYGILSSRGRDGRDAGGPRKGTRGPPVNPGDDWIMLVRPAGRGE